MTRRRYKIVESVGSRIEDVNGYEDLAKHHPSAGREPNRDYGTLNGRLEEVRHVGGRTLIKKDFVLLVDGSNRSIPVPSPLAGYVKTSRAYGTLKIYDAPTNGQLIGQILHLDPAFKVKDGDSITYGQHVGLQAGTDRAGGQRYAIHVHAELEESVFKRYIADIANGTLSPDGPEPAVDERATRPNEGNWCYPCTPSAGHALQHLTGLSKAKSGFYPFGENGLWHGGVHFDEGTAAMFDQSSVRCMADGEVIAYRIDERYPVSEFTDEIPRVKRAPFSTGFVLVKHRLQPPPFKNASGISEGQTPPSLTLYSLYMHLLDWAGYQAQPDLPRPAFWPTTRHTVNTRDDGLTVRAGPSKNATKLAALSKGAEVVIGETKGEFSKLVSVVSGTTQPALAADENGQLPGYVFTKLLKPHSAPAKYGSVVVLDSGLPIKAGDLIGHPGLYQNHDSAAQQMVHVELFSCDDVPAFITQSRAWASRLPDDQKTLLKVYKGASKLIAHRDDINADNPPKLGDDGTRIGIDLIIPQSLLDGLPASSKIQVKDGARTMQWWRLDGLFADVNGNPIDGWLAEQELITTRHSPWEWEGFQCIEETGTPIEKLAYALNARGLLSADEQQNYRAQISKADGSPTLALTRLHDIVDTDKDGVLTSKEIRTALAKPWQAQLFGQLIARYESEWFWNKSKWDELDPLLAEEPGAPNLVWEAEKQRIEKLGWWKELAGQHGISGEGLAWHVHAPMIAVSFKRAEKNTCSKCNKKISITYELMKKICPSSTTDDFIKGFILHTDRLFEKYGITSCAQVTHLLAQAKHETKRFTAFRESLYYSSYTAQSLYNMAPTAINKGFTRKGLTFATHTEKLKYIEDHLLKNDAGYGQHCFGSSEYPENDYRGRGLLHLTHYSNYKSCALAIGKPIAAVPTLVENDVAVIVETGLWFWKNNRLKTYAEDASLTEEDAVEKITRIINGGTKGLAERKQFKREITKEFIKLYGDCAV
ncbi:glycoside hydrolase family 19 protein [Stutzerimonas urumqiensis]|uniref:glycoside hydrolase family 19 protein n=1 Tax=Stutzerimonas urumqiensis TaxID=638269 RepID=UPI003BAB8D40